jgi:predicted alpha/beta hydrolase family esterase
MMAALWVVDQCRDLISSWPGPITFTGHSLGGGTSAIAATFLRLRENYTNVRGIVFATGPALSEQLVARTRSFVTTFIVDRDPISRISPLSMKQMVSAVASITETST